MDQADLYDQLICKASSVFTKEGWRLLLSAQKAALFDSVEAPPGLVRRMLHLWAIPDFNSLPQVMARAADNPDYVKAQALTIDETQNLHVTMIWDSPIGIPDKPVSFYMLESLHMINNVQARFDFANYMNRAVYDMSSKYGWKILFAGNAATGMIDHYVNIWGMADTSKLEEAILAYRSDPAWTAAVIRVATSMWTPRPLPCFDELAAAAPAKPA